MKRALHIQVSWRLLYIIYIDICPGKICGVGTTYAEHDIIMQEYDICRSMMHGQGLKHHQKKTLRLKIEVQLEQKESNYNTRQR